MGWSQEQPLLWLLLRAQRWGGGGHHQAKGGGDGGVSPEALRTGSVPQGQLIQPPGLNSPVHQAPP